MDVLVLELGAKLLAQHVDWHGFAIAAEAPVGPAIAGGRVLDVGAHAVDRAACVAIGQRAVGADAGDMAVLRAEQAIAGADEAVFDQPERFRVDRAPNDHLALGIGSHFCLGANLARMEIEVVIGRILERLPDLQLAPGAAVVEVPHPIIAWLERMPVEFTPTGRA